MNGMRIELPFSFTAFIVDVMQSCMFRDHFNNMNNNWWNVWRVAAKQHQFTTSLTTAPLFHHCPHFSFWQAIHNEHSRICWLSLLHIQFSAIAGWSSLHKLCPHCTGPRYLLPDLWLLSGIPAIDIRDFPSLYPFHGRGQGQGEGIRQVPPHVLIYVFRGIFFCRHGASHQIRGGRWLLSLSMQPSACLAALCVAVLHRFQGIYCQDVYVLWQQISVC